MLWAWLPRKSGGAIQGRIQIGGLKPTIRKAGGGGGGGEGGGVLYALGPIRKGGGGVAVHFRMWGEAA